MKSLMILLVALACAAAFPVGEEAVKPETPVVPPVAVETIPEKKVVEKDAVKKEEIVPAVEATNTPAKVEEAKVEAVEPKSEIVKEVKPEVVKEVKPEEKKEDVKAEVPKAEKVETPVVPPAVAAVQEEKKSEPEVPKASDNMVALAPAPVADSSAPHPAIADAPAEATTVVADSAATTDSNIDTITATPVPVVEKKAEEVRPVRETEKDVVKTVEEKKPEEKKKEDKSSESSESQESDEKVEKQKDQPKKANSSEESDETSSVEKRPVVAPAGDAPKVENKPPSQVTTTFLTDVIKPVTPKAPSSS